MQPLTSYPDFQLRHCELNTYNYLLLFLDTPLYWDIRKDKKLIMIERIQEPMKDANKTQGIGTIQTGGQLAEYLRVSWNPSAARKLPNIDRIIHGKGLEIFNI